MKMRDQNEDMLPEYDFSKGVIRGKYAKQYHQGSNVVVLAPDVARRFPNSEAVNQALRSLARIQGRRRPGKRKQSATRRRIAAGHN